jgi:hypothetical protein
LILPGTRLAFRGHHADDREGLVLDFPACAAGRQANDLADRVVADPKQLIANGAAEHSHLGGGGDVLRREEGAHGCLPRADERKVNVSALDLRVPILVAGHDLSARVGRGGHVPHAVHLGDRLRVFGNEGAGVALALPYAALSEIPGGHHDHVGAGD